MELRTYQRDAVDAVWAYLRKHDDANPAVVLPTGSGKSIVIAELCREAVQRWSGRVLILAHVKELLEQAVEKIQAIGPDLDLGVYSAGLKRRDTGCAVTVAGIQSVWKRACELGPVDLILIDEAHMVPAEDDGMYRRLIADMRVINPHVRIVGLTATPYRLKTGEICGPPPDSILNEVCYEVGVRELIVGGYLSPLRTKAGRAKADTSGLHLRGGEFIAGEAEDLMDDDALVEGACAEIAQETQDRGATLIFASGIRHGRHIQRVLGERHGLECGFVSGDTPAGERAEVLGRFRRGELRYLANVNVLTTGFDAPHIDCVALLRPTMSPGLYYQMTGRGFRLAEGKSDCLVLDFGGNVLRHGPVDAVRVTTDDRGKGGEPSAAPAKECPSCRALIAAGYQTCPDCGHEFPPPSRSKHEVHASREGILTGQATRSDYEVEGVTYHVHWKRHDPGAALTMRVEYDAGLGGVFREWVCFDHDGYARRKAEAWWRARSSAPPPASVQEAVELAKAGALAPTWRITVEKKAGEKYDRVVAHRLGDKPPPPEGPPPEAPPPERPGAAVVYAPAGGDPYDIPEDEIPF